MTTFVSACKVTGLPGLPWLRTTSIWAMFLEVLRAAQERIPVRMALALHGKSIVNMISCFEKQHEAFPQSLAFAGAHERVGIANHDQRISSSRQQDIQPFWS